MVDVRHVMVLMVAALAGTAVAVAAPAQAEPMRRGLVVRMPHCAYEDGSGSRLPCRWDAGRDGNGRGESFVVRPVGARRHGVQRVVYVYDNGRVVRGALPCETVTTEGNYSFCDG